MLANFLIGLREGLEAGLVVSILVAYLVKTERRALLRPVWLGIASAVVLSMAFGALLTYGPRGLTFEAQEAIGGTLSILAVGLVTWMVFWMAKAARGIAAELNGQIDAAAAGFWSLFLVAILAVGREGLETALFLWAATNVATSNGTTSSVGPLLAAALGIAVAALLAWLLYRGAVRINLRKFFKWSGVFVVVIAAGVLSYGVHDLQEAGVLPGINNLLFDVSNVIDPASWYGTLLKGVFNFSPQTTVLQGVVWLLYIVPTMALFLWKVRVRPQPRPDRAIADKSVQEKAVA
jgi:high-affinity iron transporter